MKKTMENKMANNNGKQHKEVAQMTRSQIISTILAGPLITFLGIIFYFGGMHEKVETNYETSTSNRAHIERIDTSLGEISTNLASVNASRFTAKDGLEIWQEIGEIKKEIALVGEKPPQWIIKEFDDIKIDIDRLEDKLDKK